LINEVLREEIVTACREVAGDCDVVSICLYGSRASGYAREDSDYDVLLVLRDYSKGVLYHYRDVGQMRLAILAVDQKALELDVEEGTLGDFVSGRLLTPYTPVLNGEYIRESEVQTKRRFAEEDLCDLVVEYGELSRVLTVKPEYLVLARMEKRAKAYPPLRYSYINMLRGELKSANMRVILNGYNEALEGLQHSKIISFDGENIALSSDYVDRVLPSRTLNRVVNLVNQSRSAFQSYLTHGKAGKVSLEVVARELASKLKRELQIAFNKQEIEDPKNHLFLKTERGLISLNKRDAIIDALRRIRGEGGLSVKTLGGALNEVYLVTFNGERMVVKKFTDWFNFKWFILNVAAHGTKIFTLSGKDRLSNEYVTNQLLAENGIPIPEVVSISLEDRLLVEKYIEGKSALEIVEEAFSSESLREENKTSAFEIGRLLAEIHDLNVTLGDCKPENFIVGNDGRVYVLDLEQGERHGDKAWDVAEFLYFSGHFGTVLTAGFQQFAKEFTAGYSTAGKRRILRRAGRLRYTKVFFAWTSMPIVQGISAILLNA
jgi:tRNA A-37 threonylcarbamoyl transferase component Bud32/predicted nucleotidyltransferase